MDDVIKNIQKKLSADNLVEMMKDAKVIDDHRIKEADVRKTLEKVDPNKLIDVNELAAKLNEITEEAASVNSSSEPEKLKPTTVLSKSTSGPENPVSSKTDDDYLMKDNITAFLD